MCVLCVGSCRGVNASVSVGTPAPVSSHRSLVDVRSGAHHHVHRLLTALLDRPVQRRLQTHQLSITHVMYSGYTSRLGSIRLLNSREPHSWPHLHWSYWPSMLSFIWLAEVLISSKRIFYHYELDLMSFQTFRLLFFFWKNRILSCYLLKLFSVSNLVWVLKPQELFGSFNFGLYLWQYISFIVL